MLVCRSDRPYRFYVHHAGYSRCRTFRTLWQEFSGEENRGRSRYSGHGYYKLVTEIKTRKPLQLYDLETDPRELHNLAQKDSHDIIRRELFGAYCKFLYPNPDEEKFKLFKKRAGPYWIALKPVSSGWGRERLSRPGLFFSQTPAFRFYSFSPARANSRLPPT
jgi:hypothetical protein